MYMNRKGIQFGVKDTWSLDSTLNPIILSALNKFKEVITDPSRKDWVGVPSLVLADLYPDHKGNYTDEQLEEGSKLWLEIIDKMIYAFNTKNEPNLKDYAFSFNHNTKQKENGNVSLEFSATNENEYSRYKVDEALYRTKVEEGLVLFGKFYQCLWW
ncbi:TPA: hypothetical protein MCM29_005093 [Klebsiella pneumoniae]|nr:hypothetical protein [Klebsiella pneumoniae]